MNILVVYYSCSGTTAKFTAVIIKAKGATGRELVDTRKRTGITGRALAAMLGNSTRLKDPNFSVEGFDTIVLMTPIWAGHLTPAMNTFLKKVDLTGKRVIIGLVGAADENLKAAEKMKQKIEGKGGKIIELAYLKGVSLNESGESLTEEHVAKESDKIVSKLS